MSSDVVIMKFGGASVSSVERFADIADIIIKKSGNARVVVVVSAMGNTTDELLSLAKKVHPEPPPRELDMLVSVGERISISLLAMALHGKGRDAMSFTGSQSGIITTAQHSEARIIGVKPQRLLRALEENKIVIVAGFQGVSMHGEITTLGRGGSDTTAVALGVALKVRCVEFYKDVRGIYSEDPKENPEAICHPELSYADALRIARKGSGVLHPRCIELAAKNQLLLHLRSFHDPALCAHPGTLIGDREQESQGFSMYEGN
jgi:aspartate kinase